MKMFQLSFDFWWVGYYVWQTRDRRQVSTIFWFLVRPRRRHDDGDAGEVSTIFWFLVHCPRVVWRHSCVSTIFWFLARCPPPPAGSAPTTWFQLSFDFWFGFLVLCFGFPWPYVSTIFWFLDILEIDARNMIPFQLSFDFWTARGASTSSYSLRISSREDL